MSVTEHVQTRELSGPELRRRFIDFFAERLGVEVPSASLVPKNDPTVLLTVAGMQQMIPFFVGIETPPAPRLCSVQKCFRTVDIDEVGDESHLTFFEMLGNFSVGDYFKARRDPLRLGAADAGFRHAGRPALDRRSIRMTTRRGGSGAMSSASRLTGSWTTRRNWWGPVGPTGPCGPDSEIYYDRGPEHGCGDPKCSPAARRGLRPLPRNLEPGLHAVLPGRDGHDTPLPRPNIDTGMGLERLAMVMQGKHSVYETDLYQPIIAGAAEMTGTRYGESAKNDRALRVMADHSRAHRHS